MAADGEIFHSEEEKFDSIDAELDPEFVEHKEALTGECREQLHTEALQCRAIRRRTYMFYNLTDESKSSADSAREFLESL